jgi:hypothetical protein
MPADTPDTPAQATARKLYDDACRDLADAAVKLKSAQAIYDGAHERYNIAYGMALQAGILK